MMKTHILVLSPPESQFRIELEIVWLPELDIWASARCVPHEALAHILNPSAGPAPRPGPASNVGWDDAVAFCQRLNEIPRIMPAPGLVFRLPFEAEWESYATSSRILMPPWSDICPEFGREEDFQCVIGEAANRGIAGPGEESATPWGLFIRPYLWEWTCDFYDPEANCRILRCACWHGTIQGVETVSYHRTPNPRQGRPDVGFRVICGCA